MKKIFLLLLFIAFFSLMACSSDEDNEPTDNDPIELGEFIDDWTYKVFPNTSIGTNFDIAEFKLDIPNNIHPKAILILLHSFNGNGINIGQQTAWKEYATLENIATLSVNLKTLPNGDYINASGGSGKALLFALEEICKKNNILEVADLPFLLRGYSAGGMFSVAFSEFKPERVIAFSNIRGGGFIEALDINKDIPGLMIIGENDIASRVTRLKDIVFDNRQKNGLWSVAIEPEADHYANLFESDELTRTFFTAVLPQRLNPNSNTLLFISENVGWLGNNFDKSIHPFESYPTTVNEASWLINEVFATKWSEFQVK